MAHHGWGALTGRQREQSAVATVSASSESWEAGWSDALDTRPERCRHRASSERRTEELIADLTLKKQQHRSPCAVALHSKHKLQLTQDLAAF